MSRATSLLPALVLVPWVPWSAVLAQVGPLYDALELPVGDGTYAVHVVDWDGDGVLDVVGAQRQSGTVSFSLGRGDGTFETAQYLTSASPTELLGFDADGDAHEDLVWVERTGNAAQLRAHLADGSGGGTDVLSPWFDDATLYPQALAADDVDQDGDVDVVALVFRLDPNPGFPQGFVTTLLNDGAGAFVPSGLVRDVGPLPRDVALGDFDEDGDVDAAVANNGASTVTLLFSDGAGDFPTQSDVSTQVQPRNLAVADFDADGHLDLAVGVSAGSSIGILSGDGIGGFASSVVSSPGSAAFVLAADVDADGDTDLVGGAAGPLVHRNDGAGGFLPPVGTYLPNTADLAVADLDADGAPDLVVGRTVDGISVVLGDGSGTFADHLTFDESIGDVHLVDVDEDGRADLVYQRSDVGGLDGFSVRLANGDGSFGPETTFPAPLQSDFLKVVDWTGDGHVDVLSANSLFLSPFLPSEQSLSVHAGDGTGSFAFVDELVLDAGVRELEVGDLDGDGAPELLSLGFGDVLDEGPVLLHGRTPGGGIGAGVPFPVPAEVDLELADVDGDGDLDLVTGDGTDLLVHHNLGAGVLGAPTTVPIGLAQVLLAARDLDGDGDVDLVARTSTRVAMVLAGPGGFGAPIVSGPLGTAIFSTPPPPFELADVDADGHLDAVLAGRYAIVLRSLPGGGWAPPLGVTGFAGDVAVGDVDDDGFLDLVASSLDLVVHPHRGGLPAGVRAFGVGTPGCAGVQLASTNGEPVLGSTSFAYVCNHAPANALGLLAGSQGTLEAGAPLLGILAHVNPAGPLFVLDVVTSDAEGRARRPVVLPSDPALVGATYARQFVWAWPAGSCVPSPLGWSTSRGVEVTLR